jgi:hypothetical protein
LLSRGAGCTGATLRNDRSFPGAIPRDRQSIARMPEFVPNGYISVGEALNRVGRELFASEWTGEEHKARHGLISEEEWLKIKNVPPARGSGAPGSGTTTRETATMPAATPHSTGNPSDPAYQDEYRASKRHAAARDRLRVLLERGELEAAMVDSWTGALHRASTALWRRHDADRMLQAGQTPLPRSRNTGCLYIKQFAAPSVTVTPLPQAKIAEAIEALREKLKTESLTRLQQADFVHARFPTYRVTERQLRQIYRAIPAPPGRPKKSDK